MSDDELRVRAKRRKLRLLMRRGAALARLGALEQAVADYELALVDYTPEINPERSPVITNPSDLGGDTAVRAQMRADLAALKERLEQLNALKVQADGEAMEAAAAAAAAAETAHSGGGGPEAEASELARARASDALATYTSALVLAAMHVPTLANAAAAALGAGAFARCVALCDSALRIAGESFFFLLFGWGGW
ncbi:hypothetical protein T492DRAFT_221046 [Pavlovales sp. CCMP2436]|nr:hypothetical protein T492DRAFT_221046 [Pavlovales sp. CCMP2436]